MMAAAAFVSLFMSAVKAFIILSLRINVHMCLRLLYDTEAAIFHDAAS